MVPYYTLALDICIRNVRESDDVWMRCIKLVPFIPTNGVTLELWQRDSESDEETTHQLTLAGTYYSFQHSMFIEEQTDDSLDELIRAGQGTTAALDELIKFYKSFGFERMTFPTAQVVR